MIKEIQIPEDIDVMRADRYVSEYAKIMSRSQLKSLDITLTVNGTVSKLSKKIKPADILTIEWDEIIIPDIKAEKMDLDIVYENKDSIVFNKARGMVVHPASGHYTGTLAQGLAWLLKQEINEHETVRAGIVHRLDKDTSGVIITAKTPEVHEFLAAQFKEKTCQKTYLAVVKGHVKKRRDTIETLITRNRHNRKLYQTSESEGKLSITSYKVLRYLNNTTLVALYPKTGRTHQLRVHMQSIGNPICGDPLYSRGSSKYPLMLHAYKLKITLPGNNKQSTFRAHIPEDFKLVLSKLR